MWLTHTWIADVNVELTSPQGLRFLVKIGPYLCLPPNVTSGPSGDFGDDLNGTTFYTAADCTDGSGWITFNAETSSGGNPGFTTKMYRVSSPEESR